jgi:hypothetical protein
MTSQEFTFTGLVQSFTVPDGVTSLTIKAIGGGGGQGRYADGAIGRGGGIVNTQLNVNPNDILNIYIGDGGKCHRPFTSAENRYSNGGNGGKSQSNGGGGGACTCITLNNDSAMVVIAGGGGGGAYFNDPPARGGHGGGNDTADGENGRGGTGGEGGKSDGRGGFFTPDSSSNGGNGSNNGLICGNGGNGGVNGGNGGGGGGYGGGAGRGSQSGQGGYGGGGGGSSFVNPELTSSTSFNYVQLTTGNDGTYGAGGESIPASGSDPGSSGNPGYVLITWNIPISNICFPSGTPVKTDQGIIPIDKIDINYNTINNKQIEGITQTRTIDRFLVCFKRNSLGPNYPTKDTIMTKDHKVKHNGKLLPAHQYAKRFKDVRFVKYTGEVLYNVLLETYSTMNINNMTCETLHPNNIIAKMYTNKFTERYNNNVISVMNYSLLARDFASYKSIVNRAHS